jgi:hypothetical protein
MVVIVDGAIDQYFHIAAEAGMPAIGGDLLDLILRQGADLRKRVGLVPTVVEQADVPITAVPLRLADADQF